jgi:hypothetical protein
MANPWRKRPLGPVLSPGAVARQGRILQIAIAALGSTKAVAFLNTHSEPLAGRPLDLAIASAAGLTKVEAYLAGLPAA